MEIKVIDLLNKIANGEIPKKIKYDGTIYTYDDYKGDEGYVDKTQYPYKWFEKEIDCDVKQYLNDEVEIIEEEKKIPEKLGYQDNADVTDVIKSIPMISEPEMSETTWADKKECVIKSEYTKFI